MLIETHHGRFLGLRADGTFFQTDNPNEAVRLDDARNLPDALKVEAGDIIPVQWSFFHVLRTGRYICALPNGGVAVDRHAASSWETLRLVPEKSEASNSEGDRFVQRVEELTAVGEPIKLHMACGLFPVPGFLNLDYGLAAHDFMRDRPDEYFIMPTVGVRIPLSDNSVDYIFHEDFIEHIDQLAQIQFLAETRRIMKPGAVHRVNTPNLLWTMAENSDFSLGYDGVYTGERQWDHIAIYSPKHLEEIARLVGYSDVQFNLRGESISPHAFADRRPYGDRDEVVGNIFADLVK